jgi:hypothetical protein
MSELSKLSGAGGCQIINAAGIYSIAGKTLIPGVCAIEVVKGAVAAITALKIQPDGKTAIDLPAIFNVVGTDLTDFAGSAPITVPHPVSSITVAANVKLKVYAE